jgi:hypothetical protein
MVTYCTTCRNRLGHLLQTIPMTLANLGPTDKWIILDYGSDDPVAPHLKDIDPRVSVFRVESDRWRVGHAKNVAHRLGIRESNGFGVLCNLDADNWVSDNFSRSVSHFLKKEACAIFASPCLKKGAEGRVAMRINDFEYLGGYDERMEYWGYDVTDLKYRAQKIGLKIIPTMVDSFFTHDDSIRVLDPLISLENPSYVNRLFYMENVKNGVINPNGRYFGLAKEIAND